MSEIRLNIIERERSISGEVDGLLGDMVVAVLTAEPDTVEELALALRRFVPWEDESPFVRFVHHENFAPHDAGIIVVDLAGRMVVADSSYSVLDGEGDVPVTGQGQFANEDVAVPYRLSHDWLFVGSVPKYQRIREQRREEWAARVPIDARTVLYGRPLLEFVARECRAERDSTAEDLFARVHAKWLMSSLESLAGRTPREVLLEKHEFLIFELQWRALQWSFTLECPPPLLFNSNAYRFAGFGTHELVVYYDLVRYLLGECFAQAAVGGPLDVEVERLEQLKAAWLESPRDDYGGRKPAQLIEWERRRVNNIAFAKDLDFDQGIFDLASGIGAPFFWHLDTAGMDDWFEFSTYVTREDWDAAQRRMNEFNPEYDHTWTVDGSESYGGDTMDLPDGDDTMTH